MTEVRFTPVDPPPVLDPKVGFWAIVGRFVVRMWLDDTGQPSTGRVLISFWMPFAASFYWRALTASGAVAVESVFGVTAITMTLMLWNMALKLGAGVFVPVAEAVAGVFTRSVRTATTLWDRTRAYGGGPDRSVGVTDPTGELYRSATRPAFGMGGDNPLTDDERDE